MSQSLRVPGLLDAALDRSLLGYTRLGPAVRRRWWPADPEPGALAGRRVLVTGATSGLGTETALGLGELGAAVHVLGRNPDKVRDTVADLRRRLPDVEVVEEVCDVGDLDAVRTWAAGFTYRVDALHGLVLNAGVMPPERTETAQGHEQALAVHVLGPHLMLHLLDGVLRRGGQDDGEGGGAEVVWMSSGGMYSAGLRSTPETIEFRDGDYQGIRAYARTKRMQVVLADRWARSLAGSGVRVESMHPGWAGTPGLTESMPGFGKAVGVGLRDARAGADTAIWLVATRPDSVPPHFWHDRAQRPATLGWQRGEDPAVVQAFVEHVEQATDARVGTGVAS